MTSRYERFENRLYEKFGPIGGGLIAFVLEVVQIVIISAAIIVPVRYFLIQPFYVKGASMEPNFYEHEYLVIDEISYRFREPVRGEVVVFRYPHDPSQFFIKRVIGLPGETIEITGGNIIIYNEDSPNGMLIDEEYINQDRTDGKERVTLGAEEYYLMGDNRDASLDSRSIGPISIDAIIGRAWIRGLPLSRMGTFELPDYNF